MTVGQVSRDITEGRLLDPALDPAPVEIVPATGREDVLLVCEHAGRAVPRALGDMGVSQADMARHIASDIGAEAVARALAERLGCALIVQRYSRLVIDCNRPPGTAQSMPEVSDGTLVPANAPPAPIAADRRVAEIFEPFAAACLSQIAAPGMRAAFSIHSFEPVLAGQERPWDVGLLYRAPFSQGDALCDRLAASDPQLLIGRNEPYRIETETDWFIPCCVEPRGLPHALIEIRNDLIRSAPGIDAWAERLARLLGPFCDGLPAS